MRRYLLPLLAVFLGLVQSLHAQLQVGMEIKRRFLMVYEPIVVTVTVKNLAGRDIVLADSPTQSWFGFQINRLSGEIVPPLEPNYRIEPLSIPAGQTVQRRIMLNTLFPIHELGQYKIRATVYFAAIDRYFQSLPANIELSEGRTIWQQTVGIPEGREGAGTMRRYSLLSFRQADYTYLYVRVDDADGSMVYSTNALGRVIAALQPDVQTDQNNYLHVLQVCSPKTYQYSCINLEGQVLATDTYVSIKERPVLRRGADGRVAVVGGMLRGAEASGKTANKLSDRPVPIPKE